MRGGRRVGVLMGPEEHSKSWRCEGYYCCMLCCMTPRLGVWWEALMAHLGLSEVAPGGTGWNSCSRPGGQ